MATLEKVKCDECGRECNGAQGLATHKRWVHSTAGRTKMIEAARKGALVKKRKQVEKEAGFKCDLCDHDAFPSAQALSLHKSWVHDPKTRSMRLKAAKRPKRFKIGANGDNPLKCKLCNHPPFGSESGMRYHLKAVHGILGNGKMEAKCPECGYQSTQNGVDLHRKLKHGLIGPYSKQANKECPYCAFTSKSKGGLAWHLRHKHPDKTGIEIMGSRAPSHKIMQGLKEHISESKTSDMLDKVLSMVADRIYKEVMEGL